MEDTVQSSTTSNLVYAKQVISQDQKRNQSHVSLIGCLGKLGIPCDSKIEPSVLRTSAEGN